MNMGLAIAVFLVVVPGALVALASRRPSEASLRRLDVTVLGKGSSPTSRAVVAARLRRSRILGAVGAVVGLWGTASWQSASWRWDGVLSSLTPPTSEIATGVGGIALAGGSFVLALNVFGVLAGFAVGAVIAEWTGNASAETMRRAALLKQREAAIYLARWVRVTLVGGALSALAALALAAVAPNSQDSAAFAPASPWWAVVLIGVALAALATQAAVLGSSSHAPTGELLAAREVTRALTMATLSIVALAAFTGSTASSLGRLSSWYGWGWGDGTATAAIALSLISTAFVVAAFLTPYWVIAPDVDARAPVVSA